MSEVSFDQGCRIVLYMRRVAAGSRTYGGCGFVPIPPELVCEFTRFSHIFFDLLRCSWIHLRCCQKFVSFLPVVFHVSNDIEKMVGGFKRYWEDM